MEIDSKKQPLSLKSYISRKNISDDQRLQLISQSKFNKKRRYAPQPVVESANSELKKRKVLSDK